MNRHSRDWEDLSLMDPYWAVLSDPRRRFGGWTHDEVIASGVGVVARVLRHGAEFGCPEGHQDALDYGCGIGRLTQSLAPHFEHCTGVDISAGMVRQARELARDIPNCSFELTNGLDLADLPDGGFDAVLSFIVLQHIPSAKARRRLVEEFVRVLRPHGLLAFQVPSRLPLRHRPQPRSRLYEILRNAGVSPTTLYGSLRLHPMRMTSTARAVVQSCIQRAGGRVLSMRDELEGSGTVSTEYLVTKDAAKAPPSA